MFTWPTLQPAAAKPQMFSCSKLPNFYLFAQYFPKFIYQDMAPSQNNDLMENNVPGPHPSYIQIAKPYVFHNKVLECITSAGSTEAKDDAIRLQGVAWIDSVRKAMHL